MVLPGLLSMSQAAADQLVPGLSGGGGKSLFEVPPALANNVSQSLHGYELFLRRGAPMLTYWTWGVPLLLWMFWGPQRARWLPFLVVVVLFSFGPTIHVPFMEGPVIMPHYMAAYHYVPFFDRLWFPYRMLVVGMVVLALAIGFLVQRFEAHSVRNASRVPLLLMLFVGCTGLEQTRFGIFPFVSKDLSPPEIFEWMGEQEGEGAQAVISLPFGPGQPNIVWQSIHRRPLWGGMGENASLLWPKGYRRRLKNSFFKALMRAVKKPRAKVPERAYVPVQRSMLEMEGFRWVLLDRAILFQELRFDPKRRENDSPDEMLKMILKRLDETIGSSPVAAEDRYVLWDLLGQADAPSHLQPTEGLLSAISWDLIEAPFYEMQLVEAGRASGALPPGTAAGEVLDASGDKRIKKRNKNGQE